MFDSNSCVVTVYWVTFHQGQSGPGPKLTADLYLVLRSRMSGVRRPIPDVPSWHVAELSTRTALVFTLPASLYISHLSFRSRLLFSSLYSAYSCAYFSCFYSIFPPVHTSISFVFYSPAPFPSLLILYLSRHPPPVLSFSMSSRAHLCAGIGKDMSDTMVAVPV
jgi:hypothetical protein